MAGSGRLRVNGEPTQDYLDGYADGRADKDPDSERLAYGWNRMNDYERGYVAAGITANRQETP